MAYTGYFYQCCCFCFSSQSMKTKAHQSEGCRAREHQHLWKGTTWDWQHNKALCWSFEGKRQLWFQVLYTSERPAHACHYFHCSGWSITDTIDPWFEKSWIISWGYRSHNLDTSVCLQGERRWNYLVHVLMCSVKWRPRNVSDIEPPLFHTAALRLCSTRAWDTIVSKNSKIIAAWVRQRRQRECENHLCITTLQGGSVCVH